MCLVAGCQAAYYQEDNERGVLCVLLLGRPLTSLSHSFLAYQIKVVDFYSSFSALNESLSLDFNRKGVRHKCGLSGHTDLHGGYRQGHCIIFAVTGA